ncbi:MAG: domain, Band 7 family protein, partial [Nitrososphaeraceae archaeon]|nr:domain, Band 7 family protein [Nitrososphaeraceae archaeon]MDF2767838.1 domain, Band 7 family protein [Nitrososphaeraceae archaeon]
AINIIDEQLRSSPTYLEWLKTQRWDGKLPLVTGGGGGGTGGTTPFIQIPTGGSEGGGNASATTSR